MSTKRGAKRTQKTAALQDNVADVGDGYPSDVRAHQDQLNGALDGPLVQHHNIQDNPCLSRAAPSLLQSEDAFTEFQKQSQRGIETGSTECTQRAIRAAQLTIFLGIVLATSYLLLKNSAMHSELLQQNEQMKVLQFLLHNHTGKLQTHPAVASLANQTHQLRSGLSSLQHNFEDVKASSTALQDQLASIQSSLLKADSSGSTGSCSSCTAAATELINSSITNLQSDLSGLMQQGCSQQVNSSLLLPAHVLHHSRLAKGQTLAMKLLSITTLVTRFTTLTTHPSANRYLQSLTPLPGNCLPLKGSQGYIDLQLPSGSSVSGVYVNHPLSRIPSTSSVPQKFHVSPLDYAHEAMVQNNGAPRGTEVFEYTLSGNELQYFKFRTWMQAHKIRFQLVSSHGSAEYTCIYSLLFTGSLS